MGLVCVWRGVERGWGWSGGADRGRGKGAYIQIEQIETQTKTKWVPYSIHINKHTRTDRCFPRQCASAASLHASCRVVVVWLRCVALRV